MKRTISFCCMIRHLLFLTLFAPLAQAQKDEKLLFKKEPQAEAIASATSM